MTDTIKIPVITLYDPWATWVILGFKSIETRTHNRFRNLLGKRIGIHSAELFDVKARIEAHQYLASDQCLEAMKHFSPGCLLGSAFVKESRQLTPSDSRSALIDCENTMRYGLILDHIQRFETPIRMKGHQGIWYADIPRNLWPGD